LRGSDVGVYAQTAIAPSDKWELRTGVRFDNHNAPFAGNQHQVSPRVKLSFFPDPANTFRVYYGRLFLPTNVEDLRAITSDAQGGDVAAPTLPERDDFYEVGYVHRFPPAASTSRRPVRMEVDSRTARTPTRRTGPASWPSTNRSRCHRASF